MTLTLNQLLIYWVFKFCNSFSIIDFVQIQICGRSINQMLKWYSVDLSILSLGFNIFCLGSGGDSSGYSRTQSNFLPYGELFEVINRLQSTKEYSDAIPKAFLSVLPLCIRIVRNRKTISHWVLVSLHSYASHFFFFISSCMPVLHALHFFLNSSDVHPEMQWST